MAENVQENKPPEPPPKPPEVPKPTEQSNRSGPKDQGQPHETQQSAHQDARNAAQSEHAKATSGREPDGLRPTPEVQARLEEHSAAKNGPEGLRPTPEVQERLDAQTAAKAERNTAAPQDSTTAQRPQEASTAATVGDRDSTKPAAEGDRSATAQAAEGVRAEPQRADSGKQQPAPEQAANRQTDSRTSSQDEPQNPPGEYNGPERRQHEAQHLDPAHDLRSQGSERDVPRATTDDPPRPGDRGFDPGEHRGELRSEFRPGTHDPDGLFQGKEREIADRLAEDGASVHPRVRVDSVEGKKNPDSMVRTTPDDPGTITEFKTLKSANSGAIRDNILAAGKQVDQYGGGDAVLDGRHVNLTDGDARRGYARAVGQAKQMDLPMPERVMIIMGDGSIKVFPEE